jgi:hypothetical protein
VIAVEHGDAGQVFDGMRVLHRREFTGQQVEAAGTVRAGRAGHLPFEADGGVGVFVNE